MNWFTRTLLKLAAKSAGVTVNYSTTDPKLGEALSRLGVGGQSAVAMSGKAVTEESILLLTAAWSCMRILSETVGTLPWAVYRKDSSGNATRDDEHWLARLLHQPNQFMTEVEYREALTMNLCMNGNAYSWVERLGAEVSSLMPLPSSSVKPKRKGNGVSTKLPIPEGEVFYQILDRGQWTDYPREKVWHIKGFGSNGLVGLSPLGAAREAAGFALALDEFGSVWFKQGGKPSGIVTIPNFIKDPKHREIARENLNQMLGGLSNAHKFALFEGGMKPEPWGEMPLKDMEYLLLKKFTTPELCRIYRVPLHMVSDLDKATFSNIEQQSQEFVTYTLMPYFVRIESGASRWLLAPKERGSVFLRFNPEGLLRADTAARANFYQSALQNGYMSRNEVRAKENLNRVDGLDDYTVQVNLAPVDLLRAFVEATTRRNALPAPGKSAEQEVKALLDGAFEALRMGQRVK